MARRGTTAVPIRKLRKLYVQLLAYRMDGHIILFSS